MQRLPSSCRLFFDLLHRPSARAAQRRASLRSSEAIPLYDHAAAVPVQTRRALRAAVAALSCLCAADHDGQGWRRWQQAREACADGISDRLRRPAAATTARKRNRGHRLRRTHRGPCFAGDADAAGQHRITALSLQPWESDTADFQYLTVSPRFYLRRHSRVEVSVKRFSNCRRLVPPPDLRWPIRTTAGSPSPRPLLRARQDLLKKLIVLFTLSAPHSEVF
jgi:hypothetical protein